MNNHTARHIATQLYRTMITRGIYADKRNHAQIDHAPDHDGWLVWIWEPDYAAAWCVVLRLNGTVIRARRIVR